MGESVIARHPRTGKRYMKSILFALMTLCTGCMIVVEEDPNREQIRSEEERHYYYSDDGCEEEPYAHSPEYCDVYSDEECCEWYTGYDCYETWCYDYYYCEWYYCSTECYY